MVTPTYQDKRPWNHDAQLSIARVRCRRSIAMTLSANSVFHGRVLAVWAKEPALSTRDLDLRAVLHWNLDHLFRRRLDQFDRLFGFQVWLVGYPVLDHTDS